MARDPAPKTKRERREAARRERAAFGTDSALPKPMPASYQFPPGL